MASQNNDVSIQTEMVIPTIENDHPLVEIVYLHHSAELAGSLQELQDIEDEILELWGDLIHSTEYTILNRFQYNGRVYTSEMLLETRYGLNVITGETQGTPPLFAPLVQFQYPQTTQPLYPDLFEPRHDFITQAEPIPPHYTERIPISS
jgi:hypothetical protein